MVNIALNGSNGKMGKAITELTLSSNTVKIVAGIDRNSDSSSPFPIFKSIEECTIPCDVVLDFSRPDSLDSLIKYCSVNKTPLILCTTGYSDEQLRVIEETSKKLPIFRSANMSIGINLLSNILSQVSDLLFKDFDIEIIEKHHNQKVDAPSGTALLLANSIKDSIKNPTEFTYGREGICKRDKKEIGIHAIRGGTIVGEHEVIFAGADEIITLSHTATSRKVFAIGSLKACEFMKGKEVGFYDMNDVIKASTK
jgi:4-hydroxy-tetrahydrodipicolinate reductase